MKTKNRWLIAASAVGIHVSIGSIYAYSAWKMPLENALGWSSTKTAMAFSIAIFFLGVSAAFLGRFIERKGASKGGLLAAAFFATGLIGSALAVWVESLLLFYLCFGVISGIGLGVGYITPVSTLVKWFPDRRGLATGLAIMGFGFGGLICAKLVDQFVPVRAEVVLAKDVSGYQYSQALLAGGDRAVELTADSPELSDFVRQQSEVAALYRQDQTHTEAYISLSEETAGYHTALIYDKKSIALAFLFLGIIYALIMIPSALYIAPPPEGYAAKFSDRKAAGRSAAPQVEMTAREALRTPGFYGLWIMLFINVACGIAVIATAKKMGYEMVRLPVEMASLLVMGISLFNGLGRIIWASLSDYIGRSNTYVAFFVIQIICFPLLANLAGSPMAFMLVTFLILTCYGGGFASIPAYISDLFGLKEMPTIHGFILTAWSLAGIVGPMLNAYVYERTQSYQQSLYVFGGAFVVALAVSLLMKLEVRRLRAVGSGKTDENGEVPLPGETPDRCGA